MKSVKCYIYFLLLLSTKNVSAYSPMCTNLLKNPNFDTEQVVNDTWKACYIWGINLVPDGLESTTIALKKPTGKVIDETASNMRNYTMNRVEWREATLQWSVIHPKHKQIPEVFLFPEKEPGAFRGVLNLINTEKVPKFSVTAYQLVFKLINNKYLVIINCDQDFGFLMARVDHYVLEKEVLAMAKAVGDKDGRLIGNFTLLIKVLF